MELRYGTPKSLEDITLEDVETHPIWVWVWEAGLEDQAEDETWQCPVLGSIDVTPAMTEPVITVRINNGSAVGAASYNLERDQLEGISIWQDGEWIGVEDSDLVPPLSLVAVPTINGVAHVEFICNDVAEDVAARIDR